jgi:hypothetical protein
MSETLEKKEREAAYTEVADPEPSRDVGLGLPPAPELSREQEARLWRKIDMRLMPMLSIMYLMSFLDRGAYQTLREAETCLTLVQGTLVVDVPALFNSPLIPTEGNAKIQGLTEQLKLTGDKYNIALVFPVILSSKHPRLTWLGCRLCISSYVYPSPSHTFIDI